MIIGNETREIEAEVLRVSAFDFTSNTGKVDIRYFYVVGEEKISVKEYSYEITELPNTETKRNTLLTTAISQNPIP